MVDGQPTAQISTIIAEDNRKYYLVVDDEIWDDIASIMVESTVENDDAELTTNYHFEAWFKLL